MFRFATGKPTQLPVHFLLTLWFSIVFCCSKVRVFRFATGKLSRAYDESLAAANELQRSGPGACLVWWVNDINIALHARAFGASQQVAAQRVRLACLARLGVRAESGAWQPDGLTLPYVTIPLRGAAAGGLY